MFVRTSDVYSLDSGITKKFREDVKEAVTMLKYKSDENGLTEIQSIEKFGNHPDIRAHNIGEEEFAKKWLKPFEKFSNREETSFKNSD